MRPFAAAELYKKGLVAKVLISQVPETRSSRIGAIPGHSELNRMVLLKLGVPDAAIEMFGQANGNTKDEAVALRDWANRHGVLRIRQSRSRFLRRGGCGGSLIVNLLEKLRASRNPGI